MGGPTEPGLRLVGIAGGVVVAAAAGHEVELVGQPGEARDLLHGVAAVVHLQSDQSGVLELRRVLLSPSVSVRPGSDLW